jgi:AraC family transcriptional regulator of adaptative response / DNA-3-methyladenine glycosylase II
LFPTPAALCALDPATLALPESRKRTLLALVRELADGAIDLGTGADWPTARARLLALPGVGPWTASYLALRALRDPDVFLPTDVGVRHGLTAVGVDPAAAEQVSRAWRPWRSYALMHLWTAAQPDEKEIP